MMKEISFIQNYLPNKLSPAEVETLYDKYKNNYDLSARKKLIEHNIRLVIYEVKTKFYNNEDINELIDVGLIGLIKGIDSFDISKGISISSFLLRCIDNEIYMYFRKMKKYNGNNILDIHTIIKQDENVFDDTDLSILDNMFLDDVNLEEEYEKKELKYYINIILNDFEEIDQKIIKLYYGFINNKVYTQNEIADILDLSQAHICRKLKVLTNKVAYKLYNMGLLDVTNTRLNSIKSSMYKRSI